MKFEFYKPLAIYELGKRENQEDSIYPVIGKATADDRLFIVCDGMGGLEKGEVASQIICDSLSAFVNNYAPSDKPFSDDTFLDGLSAAYDELCNYSNFGTDSSMGTTLVFLYFHRHGCYAAHIGDSRYYHLRPSTREILYRSKDHSLVTELYENGEISKDEMMTAEYKNVITRALIPGKGKLPSPEVVHIMDIQENDWFVLCTDGMTEKMTDSELLDIFCTPGATDKSIRQQLIYASSDNADNHSAYLIHVKSVMREVGDEAGLNDEADARMANKMLNDPTPERINTTENANAPYQEVETLSPQLSPSQAQASPAGLLKENSSGNKWKMLSLVLFIVLAGLFAYLYFYSSNPQKQPTKSTTTSPTTSPTVTTPPTQEKPSTEKPSTTTSPTESSTTTKELRSFQNNHEEKRQTGNVKAKGDEVTTKSSKKPTIDDIQQQSNESQTESEITPAKVKANDNEDEQTVNAKDLPNYVPTNQIKRL